MPLQWKIDHSKKFVHIVVADGPLTLADMEEHFDAIAVAEAMGYAKLFDATRFQPVYSDDDVMAMGARLSAYTATLPGRAARLAVFAHDPALEVAASADSPTSRPSNAPGRAFPNGSRRLCLASPRKPPPALAPPQGAGSTEEAPNAPAEEVASLHLRLASPVFGDKVSR